MADSRFSTVLADQLGTLYRLGTVGALPDDQLVERFLARNDPAASEAAFRALPEPDNLRQYMQRLSARPHHVGSPYDKDNAEWILAQMKSWGWDSSLEEFDVRSGCFERKTRR